MAHIRAATAQPFETFRVRFDDAFARSGAARFVASSWEGQTLRIAGSGCSGFARFADGQLSGPIELSFATLPWRRRIFEQIADVLQEAGCTGIEIG